MSRDVESSIDEAMSHEARAVAALEAIADALTMYSKIQAQRFEKEYPVKREPLDATITYVASPDDKLRESQGATGESQEEWEEIGPRERALLDQPKPDSKRTTAAAKSRSARKAGSETGAA